VLITEWWSLCPDSMVGAYCAKSGIFVIDPDAPKQRCPGKIGDMTPDGRAAWDALKVEHGGHDPTYEVETPGGGLHVYFRADPARPVTNSEGSLGGLGINVRSNGYVILPPSRRKDGKPYVANQPFTREALAQAPGWLYAALGAKRRAKPKAPVRAVPVATGSTIATVSTPLAFPLTKENAEQLHNALLIIPAGDRTLWLRILMALRSIEPEWGDASRKIAVWWSKRSTRIGSLL
jgi:Bifunctional DNA primase/polymerase, N-terminal